MQYVLAFGLACLTLKDAVYTLTPIFIMPANVSKNVLSVHMYVYRVPRPHPRDAKYCRSLSLAVTEHPDAPKLWRLVQFWLNLSYKCYLTLHVYNFCVSLLILYMFYTHLICQIKIKFDFASIFCQFYVLYYGNYSIVYH